MTSGAEREQAEQNNTWLHATTQPEIGGCHTAAESNNASDSTSDIDDARIERSHLLTDSFQRSRFSNAGNRAYFVAAGPRLAHDQLSTADLTTLLKQEFEILQDADLLPSTYAAQKRRRSSVFSFLEPAIETTPLMQNASTEADIAGDMAIISRAWEEAADAGKLHTTMQRESLTIFKSAVPLVLTFLGQYSLLFASTFSAGHLGVAELGAASLGAMSANISGYAVFQGLSTSLDTLCPQAFGSGRTTLVGLQTQRMVYFLWGVNIPIAILWFSSEAILRVLVPEASVAIGAALYLKVLLIGTPGFAAFEAGKRFCQAQGLFSGPLWVLVICAPINIFLSWYLVWRTSLGFIGAPLSVAITHTLLPLMLFFYIRFISASGMSCWGGFSRLAFTNWTPLIRLAIPGLLMIEAEVLAFEILTFAAARFGSKFLAGQAIVAMIGMLAFQIPFPLSIAGSTRLATLIGAGLIDAAKLSLKVTLCMSVGVGLLNVVLLWSLRGLLPTLFTDDAEVIDIVSGVLPLLAAFQFFDATAACCNGMLRGLGRQEFGGYLQVFAYYVLALPVSFALAFGASWKLVGLWTGVSVAMALVVVVELIYLRYVNWDRAVADAMVRTEADRES